LAAKHLDPVALEHCRGLGGGDRRYGLVHRGGHLGEGRAARGGLDDGLGRHAAACAPGPRVPAGRRRAGGAATDHDYDHVIVAAYRLSMPGARRCQAGFVGSLT